MNWKYNKFFKKKETNYTLDLSNIINPNELCKGSELIYRLYHVLRAYGNMIWCTRKLTNQYCLPNWISIFILNLVYKSDRVLKRLTENQSCRAANRAANQLSQVVRRLDSQPINLQVTFVTLFLVCGDLNCEYVLTSYAAVNASFPLSMSKRSSWLFHLVKRNAYLGYWTPTSPRLLQQQKYPTRRLWRTPSEHLEINRIG